MKRESPVEMGMVISSIKSFYNSLNRVRDDSYQSASRLLEVKRHYDNSFNFLKGLIEPERNGYVRDENRRTQCFKWFEGNIGRMLSALESKTAFVEKVSRIASARPNDSMMLKFEDAKQTLLSYMEQAILYPITQANLRYKEFEGKMDGKTIVKDNELWLYFLFLNMYHASQYLGALTKEKPLGSKNTGSILGPSLSAIPHGVRTSDNKEDENPESGTGIVEEYFKEDFDDED